MKKIRVLMIIGSLLVLISTKAFSQYATESNVSIIKPYRLAIAYNKTTSLIFPFAIKSVDRGSRDVLAQKAVGTENILQIKGGKANFKETNLTVITADGKLYSYVLNYSDNPATLTIMITADKDNSKPDAFFSPAGANEARIQFTAGKVANEKRTIYGKSNNRYGMKLQLYGLYIKEDVMYYQIRLVNNSNINYDIDMLRFFIHDEKKAKRTASQEIELQPLYVYGDKSIVKGGFKNTLVITLPKLTIPDKKYLAIQLMEKNGGRHLRLKVHNRTLVRANRLH